MTSSPPRRSFLPEPVETVARSSRRLNRGSTETQLVDRISDQTSAPSDTAETLPFKQMKTTSIARRFLPQPIETSSRRSTPSTEEGGGSSGEEFSQGKNNSPGSPRKGLPESKNKLHRSTPQPVGTAISSSRKFAPEPIEISARSSRRSKGGEQDEEKQHPTRRRFAVEPIETTSKSSHKQQAESNEEPEVERARRKFAAEPIETTANSTRKKAEHQADPKPHLTRKKFAPEPVETTVRRRRKLSVEEDTDPPRSDEKTASQSPTGTQSPRKFNPELLGTARGSFRRGDASPRVANSQTPEHPTAVPRYLRPPIAPSNSPSHSGEEVPQIHESRFSAASLAKRQTRQHSFLVPELPCIESDSSEASSAVPSLSTSPSASSDESLNRQPEAQIRESHDGNFHGYILSLAAQAAEKQMRDQAMAAYPNEQVHEPVQHFAVEDSDEESFSGKLEGDNGIDARIFRRESGADLDWHMKEMRKHHAQLEDAKKALKEDTAGQSRFSAAALSARQKTHAKQAVGGHQKGVGLAEMRNAASPPMLGEDLVFPMSVSPKMTRCDVDQIPVPRTHENEQSEDNAGEPKLWSANICIQNNPDSGLWMGFCQKKECDEQSPPTPMRSGLMTPAMGVDNYEGVQEPKDCRGLQKHGQNSLHLPLTPSSPQNDPFVQSIDQKLKKELSIEQKIEQEFHHGFITQIYNYLSLGYPSLAHQFDNELSKISRISIEELRKDDDLVDAKGYVGAPEGEGLDEDSAREGKCARWTALQLYIHEWARQQPGMADRTPNEWGVRARRGSWAF
jgi:hypothetical protein